MALPYLIKHIYNTGTEEVIRRGKKIFANRNVELISRDELMNTVSFRVKDDTYGTYYKVTVQKYDDPRQMQLKCTCAYNMSDICRHETAVLLQLQDLLDKNMIGTSGPISHDQRHTVAKMRNIDLKTVRMIAGMENYEKADELLRTTKCDILHAANEKVEADLVQGGDL